jgi:MarR family 2-MHQ and catechol resistance regulon transcriptional repressor
VRGPPLGEYQTSTRCLDRGSLSSYLIAKIFRSEADVAYTQDLTLKLWVVLSRAQAAIAAHVRDDVARHDLTLAEFGILEALHHKAPMLLGEVQKKILVSSGGITYLVDRLEKKGLVERRECPSDRRAR